MHRSPFGILEIIPIFESVDAILSSGKIIEEYVTLYKELFNDTPKYLRPFTARSDPALNSGIVPTTLAIKWALSEYTTFTKKTGIPTYPIIAPGALPFRGYLRPDRVDEFLKEFKGVKTIVIQSAFRYDFPKIEVKKALSRIKNQLPKLKPTILSPKMLSEIQKIIPLFEIPYKQTVEKLAPHINQVAAFMPKRRERLQHIGLFGYSRSMGEIKLPRAIGFAGACYSLGLPPELFGVGKGIREAKKKNKLKLVEQLYVSLKPSLIAAGRYLRTESIQEFDLKDLASEIAAVEEYVGESFGPKTKEEFAHAALVEKIIVKLKEDKNPTRDIEKAAIFRKSLG